MSDPTTDMNQQQYDAYVLQRARADHLAADLDALRMDRDSWEAKCRNACDLRAEDALWHADEMARLKNECTQTALGALADQRALIELVDVVRAVATAMLNPPEGCSPIPSAATLQGWSVMLADACREAETAKR